MKKGTIVVTGAGGRVGQEVVRSLLEQDYPEIRTAVHRPTASMTLPAHLETVSIEYDNPLSIRAALQGAEKLFWVTPGGSSQAQYTQTMVEQARACGVRHIVKLGALGCDAEPIYGADRQCWASEQTIAQSGIDHTFLRASWFNQIFTDGDLRDQINIGHVYVMFCAGRAGWVDCRDVGRAAAQVLLGEGHQGLTYNLTGPDLLSFCDISNIMSDVAGRDVEFIALAESVVRHMFRHEDRDTLEARIGNFHKLSAGHLAYVTADLFRLTGQRPTTFVRFVHDYADVLFTDVPSLHVPSAADANLALRHP